jgi:hypothetical protein
MENLDFICPKCKGIVLEEVTQNIAGYAKVMGFSTDEDGNKIVVCDDAVYEQLEDGGYYYQCFECGYKLCFPHGEAMNMEDLIKKFNPTIRVFDSGGDFIDRYTVTINDDVYTMSDNADQPNGFNQYAGSIFDLNEPQKREKPDELERDKWPDGVTRAIEARLKQ